VKKPIILKATLPSVIILSAILFSCRGGGVNGLSTGGTTTTANQSVVMNDKYQLVPSSDGNVYRLDKFSGEIWLIKGKSMGRVLKNNYTINVGDTLQDENGWSFTYLGNGKFGDIIKLAF
jgi:hypothetical protein